MNWFEVALLSDYGDLFLSSNGFFIEVDDLGDGTPFFIVVGILNDNINEYDSIKNDFSWYGYQLLDVTYKKVNKSDFKNTVFTNKTLLSCDDEFIGGVKISETLLWKNIKSVLTFENLEPNNTYLTTSGMIVSVTKGDGIKIIGFVGFKESEHEKLLLGQSNWFGYFMDDLGFVSFNESEIDKKYSVWYL